MGKMKNSIEDDMMDVLALEIQKEIDEGILADMMVVNGWTKVPVQYRSNNHAVDILEWCESNLKKHQWMKLSGSFVFLKKKDAEWFILKWQ